MNLLELRNFSLSLPSATEDSPFGDALLVFRVGGKIFLFMALDGGPIQVSLKCDPQLALQLRERYKQITPGYHLNKMHWITLREPSTLPNALVQRLVRHSYACVFKKLPRAKRMQIGGLPDDMEGL